MFIEALESRQGLKIACLEAIAYRNGWITLDKVVARGKTMDKTEYGQYLQHIPQDRENGLF